MVRVAQAVATGGLLHVVVGLLKAQGSKFTALPCRLMTLSQRRKFEMEAS